MLILGLNHTTETQNKNNNEGNLIDVNYFAEHYLKSDFPHIYNQIQIYIGHGMYARFFKKTTDLGTSDIIAFDLEGLSDRRRQAKCYYF